MEKEIVLINKSKGRFTINFQGVYDNKWAMPEGEITLSEKEYKFVQTNYPSILGNDLVLQGEETETNENSNLTAEQFFDLHHTKQKAKLKELSEAQIQNFLDYADVNDISGAIIKKLEDTLLEMD